MDIFLIIYFYLILIFMESKIFFFVWIYKIMVKSLFWNNGISFLERIGK